MESLLKTDFLERRLPLGVAVSGGADSLALLHLLAERRRDLVVLHMNHGLRGAESDADEEFVSRQSAALGLPLLVERAPPSKGNLEAAARAARYGWFSQLVRAGVLGQVATGHTADDQAETVLFRFLRGAGTAGLSAILPRTAEGMVRPLLHSSRVALRAYLTARDVPWREDSSNASLRFARNRIRHKLVPSLQREWNPNLTAALAQTAAWARAEEEYWETEILRLTEKWVRFGKSSAVLETSCLNRLPLAAQRRVVRWAVERVGSTLPEFPHVEQVLSLASRPAGCGSFRTAAWEARRSGPLLRLAARSPVIESHRRTLIVPGVYPVPQQPFALALELQPAESVYNNEGLLVDWRLVSGPLELRTWQPGDRFHCAGRNAAHSFKHFFQEAGIPSWERSGWPVIACANSILWTQRLGASAAFAPSPLTATVLRITEVPDASASESPNQKVSA